MEENTLEKDDQKKQIKQKKEGNQKKNAKKKIDTWDKYSVM